MLIGNLILISGLEPEHLPLLQTWRNDPQVYETLFEHELLTNYHQKQWYESMMQRKDQQNWLISTRTHEPIGVIGLSQIDPRNRSAEWGFYIGSTEHRLGGYAAEAEFLLLDYAFNHLNFHRIWCRTYGFNTKVLKMHERFHFTREGVMRQAAYRNGVYEDVVLMSLLKQEFNTHMSTFVDLFARLSPSDRNTEDHA